MQDVVTQTRTPASEATSVAPFRLYRANERVMGEFETGGHRSGWPYVISVLREKQSEEGILLDDHVERTFEPIYGRRAAVKDKLRRSSVLDRLFFPDNTPPIWREPWIGIFHLPPNLPEWFDPGVQLRNFLASDRFQISLRNLRGSIALSQYTADWLEQELSVPSVAVKHPTEFPPVQFSWDAFEKNPNKKLVQVGWYLRNYRAIYQVEASDNFEKVHLANDKPWITKSWERTDQHSPYRHRADVGSVNVVSWLENDEYDRLLSENVMFMEVFDASANNAVVEAIVRNTPLVVNRHPAIEEYLGDDYPLFYDDIREVKNLLNISTIRSGYDHLKSMNKTDLQIDSFINGISEFITQITD